MAIAILPELLPIEILSCAILSMRPHPRLSGRVVAVVRVHLKEVVGGLPAEHSIELRLRVSIEPGDHADRVKELVLAKTAKILLSVKGALESTSGEEAPPAPAPAEMPAEIPAPDPVQDEMQDPTPDEAQEVPHDPVQDLAPATEASDNPHDEDHPTLPAGPKGSHEA